MIKATDTHSEPALQGSSRPDPWEDATLSGRETDERRRRIAEAAYYRAERRGFAPGHEQEDWYAAEKDLRRSEGRSGDFGTADEYTTGNPD